MDDLTRIWNDIGTRLVEGPFHFRLFLQPVMAAIYAYHDGVADARTGKPLYVFRLLKQPKEAWHVLRRGLAHIRRVIVLAVVMDLAYQVIVFRWIYPFELVLVVILLAVLPYVLLRGLVNRAWRLLHGQRIIR